jgi:hypothetical protein
MAKIISKAGLVQLLGDEELENYAVNVVRP